MKRLAYVLLGILILSTFAAASNAPLQTDTKGCKDHPLFTRMPTYWIHHCTEKEFDAFEFVTGLNKKTRVEGKYWRIGYYPQASATTKPSELQIQRNFENAAKAQGGVVVYSTKGRSTLRFNKNGKEIWAQVWAEFTGKYGLEIVEKGAMGQDIQANADAFNNSLQSTGHAAVYGILFDTNKAELKPESEQAIEEIAKLLKANPALKLHVVGHTDSVGIVDANLKLSQARADAVLKALVTKHGISTARLRAFGNGPFAPVASNDNEDGRAQNRRVELVKQ